MTSWIVFITKVIQYLPLVQDLINQIEKLPLGGRKKDLLEIEIRVKGAVDKAEETKGNMDEIDQILNG